MPQDSSGQEYSIGGDIGVPDNPGPGALGHTPLIGTVRRSNDIPVVRDRVIEEVDDLDAVDIPDEPYLPIISTDR